MENFSLKKKVQITLIFLLLLSSCEQEPANFSQKSPLSPKEEMLNGDWQYDALVIEGDTFNIPDWDFEPFKPNYDLYNVKFRWFKYFGNGTYEYRAETGPGNLSLGESLNFQPTFGYWELSINEDRLIHNKGFDYVTHYKIIELTEEGFIREYQRIIQRIDNLHSDKWGLGVGDTVVYREVFVPRDQ